MPDDTEEPNDKAIAPIREIEQPPLAETMARRLAKRKFHERWA
jgi:hypothetical protein